MRILGIIFLLSLSVVSAVINPAPLLKMKDNIPGQYIVKIKDEFEVDTTIAGLKTSFFDFLGGHISSRFYAFKGFSAILPERALDLVRRSSQVAYVEEDSLAKIQEVGSWGLDRIDNPDGLDDEYNPEFDGSGVNIYVIDTGINPTHDDIIGRAAVFYESPLLLSQTDGIDCHGHGSHCAGTAAGSVYGVAKNANIFGVRVINCFGWGSTASIVDGMNEVALRGEKPAVASISLGLSVSQAVADAINSMFNNGVVISVSAGNDNDDACLQSPANVPNAITVGATDINDVRASFSNYGECVDIFAPGVSITSIWMGDPDTTNTISGTSMACPHVAGAAALVRDENPTFTPAQVTAALLNTAADNKITDVKDTPYNKLLQVKSL